MTLEPIVTVHAPQIQPPLPTSPGALGSPHRLAVLLYLARRPKGVGLSAIAEAVQADKEVVRHVLSQLRIDGKASCEGRGHGAVWFTHAARSMASKNPQAVQA